MILFLTFYTIFDFLSAFELTNFTQFNESLNQLEKRASLRDSRFKWTGYIFYYYLDYRLGETPIFLAHAIIQSKTCLRFARTLSKKSAHFEYKLGSYYSTNLGKCGRSLHKIYLPKKYANPISVARLTLRALGFDYEHNRSDRDQYLNVKMKNIPSQFSLLFLKQTSENVNTFGLGYDYRSIMHFGPQEFCKFFQKCILTKNRDKLVESAMGKAEKLTFNDAKLVNLRYCLSLIAVRRAKCLNYGYPSGVKTTNCICLRYFTGNICQYFKKNHDYCDQKNVFNATKKVKSINLMAKKNCYYLIKASEGRKISFAVKFSKYKHWFNVCNEKEHVEVRYERDISVSGTMLCPEKLSRSFTSHSNMVILHAKYKSANYNISVYFKEI